MDSLPVAGQKRKRQRVIAEVRFWFRADVNSGTWDTE